MAKESGNIGKVLTNATATGTAAASVIDNEDLFDEHCIEVWFSNAGGSCTALTVTLEGSISGARYTTIATKSFTAGELSAGFAMHTATSVIARFVRANVTVLTDTGTTTINAIYAGRQI